MEKQTNKLSWYLSIALSTVSREWRLSAMFILTILLVSAKLLPLFSAAACLNLTRSIRASISMAAMAFE